MNTHIIQSKEFSAPIPGITADAVPTEIQWMPAGKHRITAHKDGKPVTLDVLVTAASAARLQTLLQDLRIKAATGAEDLPYIDFNHDDNRAAGYITAFSWGGDDPATGGIRAMVDWTGAGKAALQGREYRRFSPSFAVNAAGEVTGAPLNMGGLVNRAAFKTITPIVAHAAAGTTNERSTNMDTDKLAADLAAAQKQIVDLTAKLAEAQNDQTIKAKEAEITGLKAKIITLETAQQEQIKLDAKEAVAAAVAQGKIPPKDTELQAHYETIYLGNPAAGKAILAKLAAPAALKGAVIPLPNGGTETIEAKSPAEIWNAAIKAKEAATTTN
jgi:phage I-like protein